METIPEQRNHREAGTEDYMNLQELKSESRTKPIEVGHEGHAIGRNGRREKVNVNGRKKII